MNSPKTEVLVKLDDVMYVPTLLRKQIDTYSTPEELLNDIEGILSTLRPVETLESVLDSLPEFWILDNYAGSEAAGGKAYEASIEYLGEEYCSSSCSSIAKTPKTAAIGLRNKLNCKLVSACEHKKQ